jgi:hypothetical protein
MALSALWSCLISHSRWVGTKRILPFGRISGIDLENAKKREKLSDHQKGPLRL